MSACLPVTESEVGLVDSYVEKREVKACDMTTAQAYRNSVDALYHSLSPASGTTTWTTSNTLRKSIVLFRRIPDGMAAAEEMYVANMRTEKCTCRKAL